MTTRYAFADCVANITPVDGCVVTTTIAFGGADTPEAAAKVVIGRADATRLNWQTIKANITGPDPRAWSLKEFLIDGHCCLVTDLWVDLDNTYTAQLVVWRNRS